MENINNLMFDNISFYLLTAMIVAALFFMMAGIRELKVQYMEGFLYLTISLFFISAHFLYLLNIPVDNSFSYILSKMNLWLWLVIIFSPALIFLFIIFGLINFLIYDPRVGLVKIFFGLSLLCYLFMLGTDWPLDLKGIITFLFCFAWFVVELRTSDCLTH